MTGMRKHFMGKKKDGSRLKKKEGQKKSEG